MKILATGLTGLIGSRLHELLAKEYSFENLSRATGINITDYDQVMRAITASDAPVVLHLAAYTNVKEAELQKELGEQSEAWQINVKGTENVVHACKEAGKKLVYLSTDLVFDGESTPEGGYTEDAKEHPLNWYAVTKFEGELRVRDLSTPWIVMRPAYPYRATYEKNDFVRLFIQKLKNSEPLTVLTDRIITPTFIDDLAFAFDTLLQKEATGIFHTVGSSALSIYDAALEIADEFGFDPKLVSGTTREVFLVGRPLEPFNSALNNAKIRSLGLHMRTFREGLQEVKKQTSQL